LKKGRGVREGCWREYVQNKVRYPKANIGMNGVAGVDERERIGLRVRSAVAAAGG
jgi:hypothetical protein